MIGLMKDELGQKIMKEQAALIAKTYSYLTDNNDIDKKADGTRKCVIERKLKFEGFKHSLEATQLGNKKKRLKKINLMQIVLEKITNNSSKVIN